MNSRKSVCALTVAAAVYLALCFAANSSRAYSRRELTFSKDVAPIFYQKCSFCHRPGEIAPMSLLSYKEARPWAKSIREKIANGTMPPWHADFRYGSFKNDRRLSKTEAETIIDWVDDGAKEGDPADLPAAPHYAEGWQIGQPDVVLTMPREFDVPAEGTVNYQYFVVPTNFKEDKWIQAAEIRPGNRSVVHHVIVYVIGSAFRDRVSFLSAGLEGLVATAPGQDSMVLPDGVGRRLRSGTSLLLQVHYTTNGKPQKDRTSIGLIFSRKPVEKVARPATAVNVLFAIPPGESNYPVEGSYVFKEDSHIMNVMPHMHLRGKDVEYRLVYPDGTSRIILKVPKYDFRWQTRYEFTEPVAAPRGTRLECLAHFDNSAGNKWNPDPTKTVRWGLQTWDEMMIGFFTFTVDDENLRTTPPTPKP